MGHRDKTSHPLEENPLKKFAWFVTNFILNKALLWCYVKKLYFNPQATSPTSTLPNPYILSCLHNWNLGSTKRLCPMKRLLETILFQAQWKHFAHSEIKARQKSQWLAVLKKTMHLQLFEGKKIEKPIVGGCFWTLHPNQMEELQPEGAKKNRLEARYCIVWFFFLRGWDASTRPQKKCIKISKQRRRRAWSHMIFVKKVSPLHLSVATHRLRMD